MPASQYATRAAEMPYCVALVLVYTAFWLLAQPDRVVGVVQDVWPSPGRSPHISPMRPVRFSRLQAVLVDVLVYVFDVSPRLAIRLALLVHVAWPAFREA